jgi:nuclear pore complex protein Nup54
VPQIEDAQAFQQSIFQCHKFGDERDATLASLNFLQACWGAGKGFYSQTFPPVAYTPSNPFYRFKAVGYAFMYTDSNEDGQVVVNFKKPQDKLQAEETQIVSTMQNLLARPNIIIKLTGTKAISENSTMAILYAEDRNTLRRVTATDMAAALCQPQFKAQLETLGVTAVNAKVKPSPEQLKRYLDNPPDGRH